MKEKYNEFIDKPDYELPEYFNIKSDEVSSNFVVDYILCDYRTEYQNNIQSLRLKIPYFAIDNIIDRGNHIEIELFEDISKYNFGIIHCLDTDIKLFVYFEYEFEKQAVIEHFNNLKKYL